MTVQRRHPETTLTSRSLATLLVAVGVFCVCAGTARAQAGVRTVVLIAPKGQPEPTRRTVQAVRGQLSDVRATLRTHTVDRLPATKPARLRIARSVATKARAAVVFWFEPRGSTLSIYLHGADGGRLLERAVQTAGTEGRFEALAVIVRFAVRAHLLGEEVGVRLPPPRPRPLPRPRPRRRAVRPPAPTPAPTPPPTRRWLDAELGYDLDIYADQALAAHGLRVALLLRLHPRWSVFAAFRMEAPIDVRTPQVSLTLRRYPLDVGVRISWRWRRLRVGAQLALGVTPVAAHATEGDPDDDLRILGIPDRVGVAVVPAVTLAVAVVRRLCLTVSLGTRFRIDNTEYRVPGQLSPLLAPWRVQPTLTVGLLTSLF